MTKWVSWQRLRALCWKELLEIVRDPSSIFIAFILPITLLFIFGFGISLDTTRVRLGISLEDTGALGHRFVESLDGSPYIETHYAPSINYLKEQMALGHLSGIVVIPSDFSSKLERGELSNLFELQTDGSDPNTANFIESYVQTIWQGWLNQQLAKRNPNALSTNIEIEPRYWFNPTTISRNYLIPGAIAVIMTIIGALLTSLVVAREWERGTMEALLSSPITRVELVLSKVLPYYLVGMIAMVVCSLVAIFLMKVPFRGSWFLLFVSSSLFLASALGLGLLVSTKMKNQFDSAQMALNAAFLPAVLLSGFMFEISGMPIIIQAITYIIPARYFVQILQTFFQVGTVWSIFWINIALLLLSGIFWLGLTAIFMQRRLDGN